MTAVRIGYRDIDFSDLRGHLITDHLVAIDADLRIAEGERTIYEEPDFPVVELARSLSAWLTDGQRTRFAFTSLSADRPGIVTIAPEGDGWCLYSSFTPDVRSSVITWTAVETCLRDFIGEVRTDVVSRGLDVDRVLGPGPIAGRDQT